MSRFFILITLCLSLLAIQSVMPDSLGLKSYAQDEEVADKDKKPDGVVTLDVTPLNFSLVRKGRVRGTISIVPVLIVLNSTAQEITELRALLPLIRSDLMSVSNLLSKKRFRINRPIDPNFVAYHFQNRIDQHIGKDRIKIYIQDAIIRPTR